MSESKAPTALGEPLGVRVERRFIQFFAAPTDGRSAALLRIGLGAVALYQSLGVWLNLHRYWSEDGLIPYALVSKRTYNVFSPFRWFGESDALLYAHAAIFSIASLFVLIGFRARLFAIVAALVHVSLQHRNPFILNSGDRLLMIQLALAAIAPLSRRWGVDARRARGVEPSFDSVWGQRFVGLQIAYVYLFSAIAKVQNSVWYSGKALAPVLASPVFAEWPITTLPRPIDVALTYGTLLFEFAFPFLVWSKRFRPWLLIVGVLFHAGIEVTLMIPIFSSIMIVSYAAFLTDEEAGWLVDRTVGRISRLISK